MRWNIATDLATQKIGRWALLPLVLSSLNLFICPAWAEEAQQRVLLVHGQGTETVVTTISQIELGMVAEAETAVAAQQVVAAQSLRVLDYLRSRNVRNLQTTGIALSPVYRRNHSNQNSNQNSNEPRITGYTARNTVSFEVDIADAGTIVDESVQRGASSIRGIRFKASEEAIAEAQQRALREATRAAQLRANIVLSSLGLVQREILSIQVSGAQVAVLESRTNVLEADADFSTTTFLRGSQILGGEQQVQTTVTLQIRY